MVATYSTYYDISTLILPIISISLRIPKLTYLFYLSSLLWWVDSSQMIQDTQTTMCLPPSSTIFGRIGKKKNLGKIAFASYSPQTTYFRPGGIGWPTRGVMPANGGHVIPRPPKEGACGAVPPMGGVGPNTPLLYYTPIQMGCSTLPPPP